MTPDDVVDLLQYASIYDPRVTLGKHETVAWYQAIGRVPLDMACEAVREHYAAPAEAGREVPRVQPGHIVAYYRAQNRPDMAPPPAIKGPKASPGVVARCREEMAAAIAGAAEKWRLKDDEPDDGVPKWRPGMDKRQLAREQAEASRRLANRAVL